MVVRKDPVKCGTRPSHHYPRLLQNPPCLVSNVLEPASSLDIPSIYNYVYNNITYQMPSHTVLSIITNPILIHFLFMLFHDMLIVLVTREITSQWAFITSIITIDGTITLYRLVNTLTAVLTTKLPTFTFNVWLALVSTRK